MNTMTFWLYIGLLAAIVLTNYRVNRAMNWAAHNEKNAKAIQNMVKANHALILLFQDKRDHAPNNRDKIMAILEKLEGDLPPGMKEVLRTMAMAKVRVKGASNETDKQST
jgi:hypothetical protein